VHRGFLAGLEHDLLQLGRQAGELLLVDVQGRQVALVLGLRDEFSRLVVLVGLDHREAVLGSVQHAGLQRLVHLAEVHRRRDGAEGLPHLDLDGVVLHADLHAFQVVGTANRALAAVDVAHAGGIEGHELDAEVLAGDEALDLLGELRIVHHALEMGEVLEEIGDAEKSELRDECRGVGRVGADHVDRAQAQALHHGHFRAELRRGEHIDADAAFRALLDELLEHLVAFVIHASGRLVVASAQPEVLSADSEAKDSRYQQSGDANHGVPPLNGNRDLIYHMK
jgi:hypothetical protein